MDSLLLENLKEIKEDIKEIRKDVGDLKYFRAKVIGGALALSFLVTVAFHAAELFFKP